MQRDSAIETFCCYAHEDQDLLDKLRGHLSLLQRQNLIHVWYDGEIRAGMDWAQEIKKHLNRAKIILLLISSDFIKSDYCYGIEMQNAIERHEREEAHVIPIILRPTDWENTPFSKLQALPDGAIPIISRHWHNQDEAFLDVVRGIRKVVQDYTVSLSDASIPEHPHSVSSRQAPQRLSPDANKHIYELSSDLPLKPPEQKKQEIVQDPKIFASRLQNIRLQKELSVSSLAQSLGVPIHAIERWEYGDFPTQTYRKRLCDLFQMVPEELGLPPFDEAYVLPRPETAKKAQVSTPPPSSTTSSIPSNDDKGADNSTEDIGESILGCLVIGGVLLQVLIAPAMIGFFLHSGWIFTGFFLGQIILTGLLWAAFLFDGSTSGEGFLEGFLIALPSGITAGVFGWLLISNFFHTDWLSPIIGVIFFIISTAIIGLVASTTIY